MHCARMLTLRKVPLSSTLKYVLERQCATKRAINFSTTPEFHQFSENARVKALPKNLATVKNDEGLFLRVLRKIGIHKEKYQLMSVGYFAYEDIVDEVDYSAFYKDFSMPDTFFSWFLVTELHVWMLMVRYMAEGKDGKTVRNNLVEAMWNDVDNRINKLGPIHPKIKKQQLLEISSQFNAALIDYDEGILSDDKVLAGALWRIFFRSECNNPEHVEKLLIYVRKQMNLFEKIPSKEILVRRKIRWVDLRSPR